MNAFVLIGACLALGLVLQFSRLAGERTAAGLNRYVISVALPALVLHEIPNLTLNHDALLPVMVAWCVMLATGVTVWLVSRLCQWSRSVTGCLLLLLPLGNTGFVGIPLIDALVGGAGVPYAILYDQFGTFLALNTLGIAVALGFSGGHKSVGNVVLAIVLFPPFVALVLAFCLLPWSYPGWLDWVLGWVAWTLVPVVMVAVGIGWQLQLERAYLGVFAFALSMLLIAKPALAWLVGSALSEPGLALKVTVLEAGMPAMISAGVLAMRYDLAPRLAASLVGYSLPLGIATLFVWRAIL